MALVKHFFIALSNNAFLNSAAKIIGPSLGANRVVAGNTIDDVIKTIKRLNEKNISATVDNLGEFVNNERDAIEAKNNILKVMEAIHKLS
ncbi:proline dehydrogenase, partial [Staphylococcus pseudintermedius]